MILNTVCCEVEALVFCSFFWLICQSGKSSMFVPDFVSEMFIFTYII